jgi:hypothetical protein
MKEFLVWLEEHRSKEYGEGMCSLNGAMFDIRDIIVGQMELAFLAGQDSVQPVEVKNEKIPLYPCAYKGCEVMRTEAEGGKLFTVCDEHWDLLTTQRGL